MNILDLYFRKFGRKGPCFYDIANSYLIGIPAYPMKLLCKKEIMSEISGIQHQWTCLRLKFPEVLSSQATSHKPKQHGYDRPIPIQTFAAAKREKNISKQKTHTKTLTPQRVSEVKGLLSVI